MDDKKQVHGSLQHEDREEVQRLESELIESAMDPHRTEEGQRRLGGGANIRSASAKADAATRNQKLGSLELGKDQKYKFAWEPEKYTVASFKEMLRKLADLGCDDIKIKSQYPIAAKLNGQVHKVGTRSIQADNLAELISNITRIPGYATKATSNDDCDFSISVPIDKNTQQRFRANLTGVLGLRGSAGNIELTLRRIAREPPTMDQLGIPQGIRDFAFPDSGIVLVTGETGSGKTTTLGSFVRHLAQDEDGKVIVTFESPIEFDYNELAVVTGIISQTEVGTMLPSYGRAVRNMLRRNPDVLLFGELRDEETIEGAARASETGHVVYSTLHTSSVAITINRAVADCALGKQSKIQTALSDSLRGIINQRLLRTPDKKGRTLILSYLGLDNQMRSKLLGTRLEKVPALMNEFVNSYGMSIQEDLETKYREGRILQSDFERVMREVRE